MTFTKRLHPGILAGEITQTLRIWKNLRARIGGRYPIGDGAVEVTRIQEIDLSDVTAEMARNMGFADLGDLLGTAKHGSGDRVFLIDFAYEPGV